MKGGTRLSLDLAQVKDLRDKMLSLKFAQNVGGDIWMLPLGIRKP